MEKIQIIRDEWTIWWCWIYKMRRKPVDWRIDLIKYNERPVLMAADIPDKDFAIGSFFRSQDMTKCNSSKVAVLILRETSIHMNQLFETVHICSNERRLCVLGFLATYCRRNNSTQCRLRRIKPDRQDAIALDCCVMHVWFNKLKCSDFFYISMWTTYQLRPNKYLTKSAQSLYYSILAHFNALVRTHLELVLCNS